MPSKRRRTAVGTAAPGTSARRPKSTSGKKHKKRHKRGHASEEQRLQDLVFGALVTEEVSVPTAAVHDSADEHSADSGADAGAGAGAGAGSGVQSDSSDAESGAAVEGRKTDAPAWVDPDDAQISVKLTSVAKLRKLRKEKDEDVVSGKALSKRLRAQFNKMHGSAGEGAGWAVAKDTDAVLSSTAPLVKASAMGGKDTLPQKQLQVKRSKDANAAGISQSVVQSVHFHPSAQVMLTAGYDRRLRLFQIDGTTNPSIDSVFFPDMPIRTARFTGDGSQIVCSGRRPFIYTFDVTTGKASKVDRIIGRQEKSLERFVVSPDGKLISFFGNHGYLILVSAQSKQWVANLKMNGSVRAATFSSSSTELLSTGGDGEVYRWDLRTLRPFARHQDEGSVGCSAIAMSPDSSLYAVGSESGVVNLYDATTTATAAPAFGRASRPAPTKTFMHLTTPVDELLFNHDSQILAMASRRTKDALKMVHVPSRTVFSNWPTSKTPLHYVTSLDFSPSSGFMSVGNDRGRALLYRLEHYTTA